jgi:hypothetical protein
VVIGVLGSPALVSEASDLAADHASPVTATTLAGFPNWDVFDSGVDADLIWGVILKLMLMVVATGLLAGVAGRASRRAGFLAGWASLVVAAGIAGAGYYAYLYAVVFDGRNSQPGSYVDHLVSSANSGAAFGLWTGWIVGAAVAATAQLPAPAAARAPVATGPIARSPGGAPITPPAPWWAADMSPASPFAVSGGASVFGVPEAHTGHDPTLVGEPVAAVNGTAPAMPATHVDDADLSATLATPLAVRRHAPDADDTRVDDTAVHADDTSGPDYTPAEPAEADGKPSATDPAAGQPTTAT